MQAVVDIGNTRIKWALLDDAGRPLSGSGVVHRGSLDEALLELAAALPQDTQRIVVANVAGERMAERFRAVVGARAAVAIEFVTTTAERFGVRCAYADPTRLGVDRWVGLLAAHHLAGGAVCVIDAGTAVTFDAVDAAGSHLGGLILPGPRLSAAALDRDTSNIGATAPVSTPPAGLALLGKSTVTAVGHGAMLSLAAALDRAARMVERALGVAPTVYLTGGDAVALRSWLETKVELRADLVLEGLALFATSSATQKGT